MAGLRTGEVLALRWEHVDLEKRRIHVRESVKGPLKDKESRVVLILDGLHAVLAAWKLKTGGKGTVVPPMRSDGKRCDEHTVGKYLRKALTALRLPRVTWYQATRHTFASHWVMSGGSIEKLKEMLDGSGDLLLGRHVDDHLESYSRAGLGAREAGPCYSCADAPQSQLHLVTRRAPRAMSLPGAVAKLVDAAALKAAAG